MPTAINIVRQFFPKVESITDATRASAIEVTARDLSSAAVKDHGKCALAVACKRAFKLDGVIISRTKAYLVKGTHARRFDLPPSVNRELVSFDRGAGFAPGRYRLNPIQAAHKLGAQQSGSNRRSGNGKPPRFRHLTTGMRSVLSGEDAE